MPQQNLPVAILWMIGVLTSLLAMGVAGREVSVEFEPHHSSLYRNLICLAVLAPIVLWRGWGSVRTTRFGRHAARNSVHFAAQWCWFYGVALLPLAEVFALEFTAPIWTALLAAAFLGEALTGRRIVAILAGFIGILVILRPGLAIVDPAALVVLASAFGFAVTYVVTKSMVATETPFAIIWWMNVVQLPIGVAFSFNDFVLPSAPLWPWVAMLGAAGLGSHYCLGRALAAADATVVAPVDFLRLPLAALVAWLLYDEGLDPYLAAGALLILAGNWANLKKG